ncbi:FMN reductase [Mesorhizobium sp. NBSH29]|uniref:NADPH-dependent FMN reductase n=1 Tax=Mesorhizobium sp. NBSH29 TaxID=2654249 RepID=UPI00189682CB|nr:NADPH-dependent FMN reductase [Mesorhizobium sp. NBSH29]QPC88393.1 FMN reductase [Mesorhizobium sp. NBSH29]
MTKPKIGIIIGSTREGRFADRPAAWINDIAKARGDIDVELLDLRDFPMPFFDETGGLAYTPTTNDVAKKWQQKIQALDGFVILAAEYNHGPTGVLKNALDYAYTEWNKKAVAFLGYGGVGGARAVQQLRVTAVELQMAPTRAAVHILWPDYAKVLEGTPLAEMGHLNKTASDMLDQLVWWTKALKLAREADAQAAETKAA